MEIIKKLWSDILSSFKGLNILWHLATIVLTYLFVVTDFDWYYFEHTRNLVLISFLFPATIIGFLVPVFAPLILFIIGKTKRNLKTLNTAYALVQSASIAWLISSAYKALTGRAHPALFQMSGLTDISRVFHFGFFKGGIFWGWPSSHTTVAFAIAAALFILYPKNLKIKILALIFALYVGIGVSVTIHWFSDFIAGAIIGSAIGRTVGKSFKNHIF